ncbi:ribbon-helix-helix domain-containing protein [Serratia fonticola]
MGTKQQISITLPNEMDARLKAKVASGEYASESEVIREGLRALLARDQAAEKWLQEQVVPSWNALENGESEGVSGKEIRARLIAEHKDGLGLAS